MSLTFLSSNKHKQADAHKYGFSVLPFPENVLEILDPDVVKVAQYKAVDTGLNNIIVEDTALYIDGIDIPGTQIKHIYDALLQSDELHGRKAVWKISLCVKADDMLYSVSEEVEGVLTYPVINKGYHFEKIFSVMYYDKLVRHPLIPAEDMHYYLPRYKALETLKKSIITNTLHQLPSIKIDDLPQWHGEYQIEEQQEKNNFSKKFKY